MPSKKDIATQHASPQSIVSQIVSETDFDESKLPDDENALWDFAVNNIVKGMLTTINTGLAYKKLKSMLPHGDFEKGLKDRGIPPSSARKNIAVADLIINSNRPTSADLMNLNFSQLLELTHLPEEKIRLLAPEEIEEFSKLPVRALRGVVKQINLEFDQQDSLEAKNANLKKQVEEAQLTAAAAITELNRERMEKSPDTVFGLPPLLANIKNQLPAITEQIHLSVLEAVNMVEQLIAHGADPEQAHICAETIGCFIKAPHMQLTAALERLRNTFGEDILGDDVEWPHFSEPEWLSAIERRQAIIEHHNARYGLSKKGRK